MSVRIKTSPGTLLFQLLLAVGLGALAVAFVDHRDALTATTPTVPATAPQVVVTPAVQPVTPATHPPKKATPKPATATTAPGSINFLGIIIPPPGR